MLILDFELCKSTASAPSCCDGSVEMLFLLEVVIKFTYVTSFNHVLISLFILAEFIIDDRLIFSLLLYNLLCYIAN